MLLCLKRWIMMSLCLIWLLIFVLIDLGLCMEKSSSRDLEAEKEHQIDPTSILKAFRSNTRLRTFASIAQDLAKEQMVKDFHAYGERLPNYLLSMTEPLDSLFLDDESGEEMDCFGMVKKYSSNFESIPNSSSEDARSSKLLGEAFFRSSKYPTIEWPQGPEQKRQFDALTLHILLTMQLNKKWPWVETIFCIDGMISFTCGLLEDFTRKYPKEAWISGKLDQVTSNEEQKTIAES